MAFGGQDSSAPAPGWRGAARASSVRAAARLRGLAENAKALRLYAERHVELAAEVLERHRGRELDQLCLAEVATEPGPELIAHLLAGDGHPFRVLEGVALHRREQRALPPGGHLTDLLLG